MNADHLSTTTALGGLLSASKCLLKESVIHDTIVTRTSMFINPQLRPFAAGELASMMKNYIIILIQITDDCEFINRLRIKDFF